MHSSDPLEQFQRCLEDSYSWRIKELSSLQRLVEETSSLEDRSILCRTWVVMLYAHVDGLIKDSAKGYLIYKEKTYKNSFHPAIFHLYDSHTSEKEKKNRRNDYFIEAISLACKQIQKHISWNEDSFQKICFWLLQIDYKSPYEFKPFLNKRNSIAHGENISIALDECQEFSEKIINFMRGFQKYLLEEAIK